MKTIQIAAPPRLFRLRELVLTLALLCSSWGPALAAEPPSVAVLVSEAVTEPVETAISELGGVTLEDLPQVDRGQLGSSREAARALAQSLAAEGRADAIVVGGSKIIRVRSSELGTTVSVEVDIRLIAGRSGRVLVDAREQATGRAAERDRAVERGRASALASALQKFSDRLRDLGGVADALAGQVLAFTLTIVDLDREGFMAHENDLTSALSGSGLEVASSRHDSVRRVLEIQVTAGPLTRGQVDRQLHSALEKSELGTWIQWTTASPRGPVYRFRDPYRNIVVPILGVTSETQRLLGPAVASAFEALPGVSQATYAFDAEERRLVISIRTRESLAALDSKVATNTRSPLADLELLELSPTAIRYRLMRVVGTLKMSVLGIAPENAARVAASFDDVLSGCPEVLEHDRRLRPDAGRIDYEISCRGRAAAIERAILTRASDATSGLPGLTVTTPEPGSDLAFRARATGPRAIWIRIDRLTPAAYRNIGPPLVEVVAGLDGVEVTTRDYDPSREVLELVCRSALDPVALDTLIWRSTAEIAGLDRLSAGTSTATQLGYLLLPEKPTSHSVCLAVKGIAPEAYAADGRQLIETVRAMAEVADVRASYDRNQRRLEVTCSYAEPPFAFEEALWKALEGHEFSRSFSPDSRQGRLVQLAFVERRGDRARVFVRIQGVDGEARAATARAILKQIGAIEGVSELQSKRTEDRFEASCWSRLSVVELYDEVAGLLTAETSYEPFLEGGLEGNVIIVTNPEAASGEKNALGFQAGGSLADLVTSLDPTVVLIEASLPDGASWIGTGFFVSPRGYLLTNHHVAGPPKGATQEQVRLAIKLPDGTRYDARYVDGRSDLDLALLKIPGQGFPSAPLGDSTQVRPGDAVIVIGNPVGYEHSVTTGIISALHRSQGRLQTNALINPGNSGGPAFNSRGEVIGVAVSGSVDRYRLGGHEIRIPHPGINFLVPIHQAIPLLRVGGGL